MTPRKPLVVTVDVETTGLDHKAPGGPRPDGVVQVGIAWRNPAGRLQVWERTCNPGEEYLKGGRATEALSVNRLSLQAVRTAQPAAKVAADLRTKLSAIRRDTGQLCFRAFNMAFDRPFLESAPWQLAESWGTCLMVEAARRFGSGNDRIPLWRACQEAGITTPLRMHSAGVDSTLALLLHEFLEGGVSDSLQRRD